MLRVHPSSATPIWKQIEDEIRRVVAIGEWDRGAAVPSVRDMAKELQVNPATVSRAYQRLTEDGVLTVKRGEGTYVSENVPAPNRTERRRLLRAAADALAVAAARAGADEEETIEEARAALARLRPRASGEKR